MLLKQKDLNLKQVEFLLQQEDIKLKHLEFLLK